MGRRVGRTAARGAVGGGRNLPAGRSLALAGADGPAHRAPHDHARAVRGLGGDGGAAARPRRAAAHVARIGRRLMESITPPDLGRFAIGFDPRDRERLHALWDEVIDSQRWSEGPLTERFEQAWADWNGVGAVAFSGWTGAALTALEFAGVRGETVLCPSNTFMATPLAAMHAGAHVEFVDSRRDDLCMSFDDFEAKVARHRPKAAFLVHIGGHIAFDTERIAELCRAEGIFLIAACAPAQGASWNGRRPATGGDAGVWSFSATKTVSAGGGGTLSSRHEDLLGFAHAFRNYG